MVTRHSPSFPLPTAAAFERLLIATSGHDSHLNIASLVAALAVPKAAIDLLHVFETDESVAGPQLAVVFPEPMRLRKGEVRARLEQVAKELGRAGFKTSMHMESGNAAAILVDRLATSAHDLAIVSASARRQPGPVAERLLRHSPVPVVVVR
jgi:nucleotide-binding universal stress UspA family protein